jgi:Family of unknown function (DUF6059)
MSAPSGSRPGPLLRLLLRLLGAVWRALEAYGWMWVARPDALVPPSSPDGVTPDDPRPVHPCATPSQLPGPGHPERVVPHIPLSAQELVLWRQLVDRL